MTAVASDSRCDGLNPGSDSGCAPVAVFAYARADHLRRSVESLQRNPEAEHTDVTFYCDAARRDEHQAGVQQVRQFVASVSGFRSVRRVYRETNFGLARSIVEGVTQILAERGRVIVLEDDLELSPHFLRYMNDALVRYRDDPRVASVHGYVYPTRHRLPETFFLRGADCWGWATWSRAWRHFDADGAKLLSNLKARGLTHRFDYDGSYPFTWMLDQQVRGRNDSWAVRWHASCYLESLLTLYPGRSLVRNIGNDASGTHGEDSDIFTVPLSSTPVRVAETPVEPSPDALAAFIEFFKSQRTARGQLRQLVYSLFGR